MDYELMVGIIGTALILIGFILNQIGVWKTSSFSYDLINLFGGAVLIYYALLLSSIPFLVLNTVWVVVSLKDVLRSCIKKIF